MREDWPHLDMLAEQQALLGTDERLKLIGAALFDVRRRMEDLSESVASAGERLHLVEENFQQPRPAKQTERSQFLLQSHEKGKRQFPSPPLDGNDVLHEDVVFLRNSLEDNRLKWEQELVSVKQRLDGYEESNKLRNALEDNRFKWEQEMVSVKQRLDGYDEAKKLSSLEDDRFKWEQEIISVMQRLDGYEESNKRFTELHNSCLQQFEKCEDMRASIQKLTSAETEIRGRLEVSMQKLTGAQVEIYRHLEEIRHRIENDLAKQRAVREEMVEPTDTDPTDAPTLGKNADALPDGNITKLLHDVGGMLERLTSLELCVQGSPDGRQQSTGDETLVNDISCMKLAMATISRSVSKLAKDVLDLRASKLTSHNLTPLTRSSTMTQDGMLGQTPGILDTHGCSAVDVDQRSQKSELRATSAPPLSICSPANRSPSIRPASIMSICSPRPACIQTAGTWPHPNHAHAKEDIVSTISTSTRSLPLRSTDTETLSSLSCDSPRQTAPATRLAVNRITTARGVALSAVPENVPDVTYAKLLPTGHHCFQSRQSAQPQRLAHPFHSNLIYAD